MPRTKTIKVDYVLFVSKEEVFYRLIFIRKRSKTAFLCELPYLDLKSKIYLYNQFGRQWATRYTNIFDNSLTQPDGKHDYFSVDNINQFKQYVLNRTFNERK